MEVTGVGDVCSFAQMDVRKHGNPQVSGSRDREGTHKTHNLFSLWQQLSFMILHLRMFSGSHAFHIS